jgi:hypothetical protein
MIQSYLEQRLEWRKSSDPCFPYETDLGGERLVIRINDFPDEILYTLIINGREITSFDDWPQQWVR